ncbi:MAG: Phenylacetic acid catabolic protein [bacterium]
MNMPSNTVFEHVSELDRQTASCLLRFIMAFADTKHFLGRRISEWVTAAPAMEASVAAANITQEELGHARSLFAMARDIPGAPIELNTDTDLSRKEFFNPIYLNHRWSSWFELITTFFLLDSALTKIIASAKNSFLLPLRQRVAKILQEEHFHAIYTKGWIVRLAATGDEGKKQLNAAIDRVWPIATAWFGPPDDQTFQPLLETGIFGNSLPIQNSQWQKEVNSVLAANGLSASQTEINWSNWNALRREITREN